MWPFKRKYYFEGMVQFDERGLVTICGQSLVWLDPITIEAFTFGGAEKKALEYFNEKYPAYKGYVQLG